MTNSGELLKMSNEMLRFGGEKILLETIFRGDKIDSNCLAKVAYLKISQ